MSKPYKKIAKSISLNESKIYQDEKNPFSRSPKKNYNTPIMSLLNSSMVEKNAYKSSTALARKARKRTCSNDYNSLIGKFLSKAMLIDDFMQKEFVIMAQIGSIPYEKLMQIKIERPPNKKLLVFDLENVLIHCIDFRNSELYSKIDINPKHIKTLSYYNPVRKTYVFKKIIIRPYIEFLLNIIKNVFTIIVFSESDHYFTDALTSIIFASKPPYDKILSNEYCIVRNSVHIKDLRMFTNWDLKDIVFVGNTLTHFMNQLDNGIILKNFIGADDDSDLKDISSTLMRLAKEDDVRKYLKEHYGFEELYSIFLDTSEAV